MDSGGEGLTAERAAQDFHVLGVEPLGVPLPKRLLRRELVRPSQPADRRHGGIKLARRLGVGHDLIAEHRRSSGLPFDVSDRLSDRLSDREQGYAQNVAESTEF